MSVHVYPLNDVIEHDTEGFDCLCVPQVEEPRTLGDDWVVIHNALDGREAEKVEAC